MRQGQPPNITTHVQATADVEPDVGVKRLHDSGRPDAWVDGNGNIHAGAGAPDSNTLAVLVRIAEGGGV
ncbi:hypothetical protein KC967_03090 [Candidatus Saccharibacteria bacterium]|nr:hypothetical protein [Candidatus Saccharibacteria bacterium]